MTLTDEDIAYAYDLFLGDKSSEGLPGRFSAFGGAVRWLLEKEALNALTQRKLQEDDPTKHPRDDARGTPPEAVGRGGDEHGWQVPTQEPQAPESLGHPRYLQILREMESMHKAKAHDYSGNREPFANFRGSIRFGVTPFIGALIRASDKWERICSLISNGGVGHVANETLQDTLRDLAAYCIIAEILLEEEVGNGGPR